MCHTSSPFHFSWLTLLNIWRILITQFLAYLSLVSYASKRILDNMNLHTICYIVTVLLILSTQWFYMFVKFVTINCNYFPKRQSTIRHCVSSKKYELNFTKYCAWMNFLLQMVLLLFRYRLTKNNVQLANALRTLLVTHHTVTTLQIYEAFRKFPSRHWESSWHRILNK